MDLNMRQFSILFISVLFEIIRHKFTTGEVNILE